MRSSRTGLSLLALALAAVMVVPVAHAEVPFPAPPHDGVYDWADTLYLDSGDCSDGNASDNDLPSNFDCEGDWKYSDHREGPGITATYDPLVSENPQEFFGVKGTGLNRAWEISTGRPDVVIAVMDSGIRWEEGGGNLHDLVNKHYLNRAELPLPEGGPNPDDERFDGYDVNGDGIFNVKDYVADSRVRDLNGNGAIDPEDLIRIFSDGVDGDGNGYVDDISGWDFFEDDNNPQDDVDYGHGTGEAKDSTAEAGTSDEDGMCPNCMHLPMRVGDSFVADVNHWAEAVVYAVDNGASVVQEALGTLNHTSFGQAAADYAYRNGVIINASEADEAAGHHMWPAAYDHTMVVNSIRTPSLPTTRPASYLYFNGCTNFGGYTYVAIPSTSCSSEATGRSSGVSGLAQSAARNAVERGEMTGYVRDDGSEADFPLSSEELMQLWRLSADDIDFSSPCPVHAFCDEAGNFGVSLPVAPPNNYATTMPDTTRYQTVQGWDYFTGYGRSNAARLLAYLGRPGREFTGGHFGIGASALDAQDRIPPEADITWPRWWQQYAYDPATGELLLPDDPSKPTEIVVNGRAAANRVTDAGGTFDYVVEWAPHVQGERFPVSQSPTVAPAADSEERSTGPWTEAVRVTGLKKAVEGELARIDVADLIAAQRTAFNPFDPATDPTSEFQPEQHAIRLRVRVLAHPRNEDDTVNNEAVRQKQIDVYPATEGFIRDDIGVPFDRGLDGIATQDAFNAATGALGRYSGGAGSPSYHDLDGDGVDELLLPTSDGVVHAYTDVATGEELPGWPVTVAELSNLVRHRAGDGSTPVDNAYTRGEVTSAVYGSILLGTLAAQDLDDDGTLEVSIGDLEGNLYVWDHTGALREGFPVSADAGLSKEPSCEGQGLAFGGDGICDDYESKADQGTPAGSVHGDAERVRDLWNARDWGINSAPAIGDLDPDYPGLEIVVGSNDAHVYAWHADGTPVEGWPVVLRDPAKVAEMDPTTHWYRFTDAAAPAIGTKILVSPALGDLDGDGDLEVVIGVNEEYDEDVNASALDPIPTALDAAAGSGNTRVYALHHTGDATADTEGSAATPHTQDQAYVDGWPVPIALAVLDLLPYVAAGPNTQGVLYDAEGDGTLEIGISPADGPAYILDHDGSSWLGNGPDGKYRTLSTRAGVGSRATDQPTLVALGSMAVGSLDGGQHLSLVGPGAGLRRLLDVLLEGDQVGAEDHLLAWNASVPTGEAEVNFPVVVNDLQFFTPPTVADVTGDGLAEVIQSTAVGDTVAVGLTGEVGAIRHFTGGWTVAAATVGDAPLGDVDDDLLHLTDVTREGYLRLWPTAVAAGTDAACVATSEWPEYGHDAANTGNYEVDAERPAAITDLVVQQRGQRAEVAFSATGDDRRCGTATRYEVRLQNGNGPPDWHAATPVEVDLPAPSESGSAEAFEVPFDRKNGPASVLVRAYDDAGNGSAVAAVTLGHPGGGKGGNGGGNGGGTGGGKPDPGGAAANAGGVDAMSAAGAGGASDLPIVLALFAVAAAALLRVRRVRRRAS